MGKNLILTTNSFPESKGEAFLEAEFPFLVNNFEKIYINPFDLNTSLHNSISNFNWEVVQLPQNKKKLRYLLIQNFGLICSAWLTELVKSKRPFYYLKRAKKFLNLWLGWLSEAERWHQFLLKFESKNTIIYSYWYENQAIPLSILAAQDRLPFRWISRAHGWDVDRLQRKDLIIPFRNWMAKHTPDVIASISEFGQRKLKKDYNIKSLVYRLGTKDIGLANKNPPTQVFKLVSISSLIPLKRVHLIINTLKELKLPYEWHHYGDGPLLNELAKQSNMHNIKVDFKGYVNHKELLSQLHSNGYDVMVHLSELEGIPVSIMECMSMGIPCIACDTGGISELVNDDNGWKIDVKFDTKNLAHLITRIAANKDVIAKKGLASRLFWKEHYDASQNFNLFVKEVLLKD